MARYIDANKLKVGHSITDIYGNIYGVRDYVTFRDIDNAPTEDVRPVVRGEWIKDEVQNHIEIKYHCSKCGYGAWGETEKTNYCPDCGADMREVEK